MIACVRVRAAFVVTLLLSASSVLVDQRATAQGHPPMVSPVAQPMTLTEDQVTGFMSAVEDLQTMADKKSGWKGADPSKPMAMAGALQVSDETNAILQKHGFQSSLDFQRVAYNASMAYAVLKEGGKEAMQKKIDGAKAEQEKAMEQMRARLSPEQAKMLSAQLEGAMKAAGSMNDVPDGNIELMKKYSDRMAKLGGK